MTRDTVVHIPPPDDESPADRRWGLSLAIVAGVFVVVLLVFQTRPRSPAFEWSTFTGPPGLVNLDSIVALDDGFAILSGVTSDGVSVWWTDGSSPWGSQRLDGAPTQLSAWDGRLVSYRVRTGSVIARAGDEWRTELGIEFPAETRSRQASGRPGVFMTSHGLVEMSLFGDVWWSPDGSNFTMVVEGPAWGHGVEMPFRSACRPPSRSSPDVPPFVTTETSLLAMVSSNPEEPFGVWPVCEPAIWTSGDGRNWSVAGTTLADDGAYVYDFGWREDMLVAVGGYGIDRPAVWGSGDGIEWTDITPTMNDSIDLFRVEAGGAGWIVLGRDTVRSEPVGWTSRDGSCWEPLRSPIGGTGAVVSDDGILLVDRTAFPQMWLATPTGSEGACR